ncbi:universal stress protein [Streptomyces sp. NY05-11A]|uniref:universal stress protein n=1 Tax=Streptomyces soliscabiei TaxID=588897 RepID=UPI0029BAF4C0|nr:universal stress protein [Streptomyces sp. NY05-11A]MDX2678365.1 universal stress protein [Streptomyces sp. NY05-11A]
MLRTITVGLDGSQESRAAAEWAAREAELRDLPLKIVHVWEPVPEPMAQAPLLGAETRQHWTERSETGVPPAEGWGRPPREAAAGVSLRHPSVEVVSEQFSGTPGDVLAEAGRSAELLVLASRGFGGLAEGLRPWRQKYPEVCVVEMSRYGSPAVHVVEASRDSSLVVVGRRIRRSPFGAHIGHVTHAVLHHSTAPVAVVPHG